MELRNLGLSDLRVSVVGLGCNTFGARIDLEETRRVVDKALDLGIMLFDTADAYGERGRSEDFLGQILGARRKDIVLATKFGLPMSEDRQMKGASRRYIMRTVEASLKRLRTDWIDLYQLHRPDPHTPIEETLRALDDLIREGKVRTIGCSNLPAWQVVEAQWTARHLGLNNFVSAQDEYNLLARGAERELLPALDAYGLGLLPYRPLASGLLTGKYRQNAAMPEGARLSDPRYGERYLNAANWTRVEQLERFCQQRGRQLIDLAFGWLLSRPRLASVIAGATRPEQVAANVSAARWKLTPDELAEVDRITSA